MGLGEALAEGARVLAEAGVDQPRREARLLASYLLGAPVTALSDVGLPVERSRWAALVARRAAREPLALITGRRGFWTLDLAVSPDTLVPRPDSETLIEAALAAFPARDAVARILDLGTGTGCLLLAALSEFPAAFGVGIDLSPAAARLAAANAAACGLTERVAFAAGDWGEAVGGEAVGGEAVGGEAVGGEAVGGRFDLILCNPPYIATAELAQLMPEVRLYEPGRALDGGYWGLAAYARILPSLPALLAPAGVAILEVGAGQLADVSALARRAKLTHIASRVDLGGVERALILGAAPP